MQGQHRGAELRANRLTGGRGREGEGGGMNCLHISNLPLNEIDSHLSRLHQQRRYGVDRDGLDLIQFFVFFLFALIASFCETRLHPPRCAEIKTKSFSKSRGGCVPPQFPKVVFLISRNPLTKFGGGG